MTKGMQLAITFEPIRIEAPRCADGAPQKLVRAWRRYNEHIKRLEAEARAVEATTAELKRRREK